MGVLAASCREDSDSNITSLGDTGQYQYFTATCDTSDIVGTTRELLLLLLSMQLLLLLQMLLLHNANHQTV